MLIPWIETHKEPTRINSNQEMDKDCDELLKKISNSKPFPICTDRLDILSQILYKGYIFSKFTLRYSKILQRNSLTSVAVNALRSDTK